MLKKNGKRDRKEYKKINHYDVAEVIDNLSIDQLAQSQVLNDWLQREAAFFSETDTLWLEKKRKTLEKWAGRWNEQELIARFIAQIIDFVDFDLDETVQPFFERPLEGIIGEYKISVIPDFMLAAAKKSGKPGTPYFFLQEFKQGKGDQHDPEGQMLAAMLLAQETNPSNQPIYGAWLQGKIWQFTVVQGRTYTASRAYDAAQKDDLEAIVSILRNLKNIILESQEGAAE